MSVNSFYCVYVFLFFLVFDYSRHGFVLLFRVASVT